MLSATPPWEGGEIEELVSNPWGNNHPALNAFGHPSLGRRGNICKLLMLVEGVGDEFQYDR